MPEQATIPEDLLNDSDIITNLEDIIQSFACSLDLDEALKASLGKILEYTRAEAASIFLLNGDDELVCQGCAGKVDIQDPMLKVGMQVLNQSIKESRSILVRDTRESGNFQLEPGQESTISTRSILCAPLVIQGETIGAIELINRIPSPSNPEGLFDESDSRLLNLLCASAALAIHNAIMAAEVLRSEKMQQELTIARSIQESFLPGYDARHPIVGLNVPATNMSGDFFDYQLLPNGKYMFNIGDVSGKGVDAALLMAKGSSLFHCLAKSLDSPAAILRVISQELHEMTTRGLYITMIGGTFDPETREVKLANAGHPPAILHHSDGRFELFESLSPPVGILADQQFEEVSFSLADGSLYLYTDGLSEGLTRGAEQAGGQADEVESLKSLIERWSQLPAQARLEKFVEEVSSTGSRFDDLTVLIVGNQDRDPGSQG
ncbi:MAG: GAF domain-containing SpoIIE family protein phosphatase [Gammaproteobacteria bacterium]|nr:SpoIIE family protein phosphatase [Pseudomonadales bacterium]MCP5349325.1 SpoIIE family protein phosphatase [Pseudomonadales bacterium]